MREQDETTRVYGDYYAMADGDAVRKLEEAALGVDWGGNGYTTRDQAIELVELLRIGPVSRLADLGSGAGWPGIFLADQSGCEVSLSDLTPSGGQAAARLAAAKGVVASSVVASATAVPFARSSFDAVSHSDLLC